MLTKELSTNIKEFYATLVKQHGASVRSLDWGSQQSQYLRFRVLSELDNFTDASLLDVGCGLADLNAYLDNAGIATHYNGVDLCSEMIEQARQEHPNINLQVCDILADKKLSNFDYVVASGIFARLGDAPFETMQSIVARMYELANKGVAFNLLSIFANYQEEDEYYANPAEVLEYCLSICSFVTIRHDYLPHDFTVYMRREPS